ncbi:MAG: TMEM175 family protein [Patescibacteria group bacterium]
MSHTRLDQLSDGIFAIVMTILVFEIKIPDFSPTSNLDLWIAIKDLTPAFVSYILSFALLFTYWRAHHFFISIYAKNVDVHLTNINALFFLFIALIPSTSSLLSRFSENELAVSIFGIHIILIGLTLFWMRRYVLYSEHIKNPSIAPREIHGSTVRTMIPIVFALIAIPLSFLSTGLSLLLFTLAVLFNLTPASTRFFEKFFPPSGANS